MTPLTLFLLWTWFVGILFTLVGAALCYLYLSSRYTIHRPDDLSALPPSDGEQWFDDGECQTVWSRCPPYCAPHHNGSETVDGIDYIVEKPKRGAVPVGNKDVWFMYWNGEEE